MSQVDQLRNSGMRIAVLCGGESTEREVSLISGRAVAAAVESAGLPVDLFELDKNMLPSELSPADHLILPVIHGKYGEDGCLSAELDRGEYAYGGCQQAASVLCYDKLATKAVAEKSDIPVARDFLSFPDAIPTYAELVNKLGLPFIMKPRLDGSSVGLYLVEEEHSYNATLEDQGRTQYIAEEFVEGIDLTVGILDEKALGVVAIRPKGGLYDYEHKYTTGMSEYQAPAEIDPEKAEQLQSWAQTIFRACSCRDLARVDFRMTSTGDLYFLEINTIPGMTATSLLPKSAQCMGITFTDLVLTWAGFALRRRTQII